MAGDSGTAHNGGGQSASALNTLQASLPSTPLTAGLPALVLRRRRRRRRKCESGFLEGLRKDQETDWPYGHQM